MTNPIIIGADIGGSHIISAGVDINKHEIIPETSFSSKVNNKDSKEGIFKSWSAVILQTIKKLPDSVAIKIGFAMPGPFHYKTGLAMFETNDKYENLYNVNVADELKKYFENKKVEFRFLNDATAFGVGVSCMEDTKSYHKIIAITLGTGFGSTFLKNGIPQVNSNDVPTGGCLWDKPFQNGMADDYFSTRWFIKRYEEIGLKKMKGVKEIATAKNKYSQQVFEEFSTNLAEFMHLYLNTYKPDLIVLGGNISNASEQFLPSLKTKLMTKGHTIDFKISNLMEDAAIVGAAKLFDPDFWNQIKNDLPNL